jgi:general secretion pathway protein C
MASKRTSKRSIPKIPPKTAERIVAISLQHPELGARRLVPLLKKKRISVPATTIQSILRREDLQSRERRLAKLKTKSKRPRRQPKKPLLRVTDKVAERIVEVSLKNPESGAQRLVAELDKKKIVVSASTVYTILKRNGLQTRKKRLAKLEKLSKKTRKLKPLPKKPTAKITDDLAERIVEISLQNPDFGARRLLPLLKKEKIRIPASKVYAVLKRHGLQSRAARVAKLEERKKAARKPKAPSQKPSTKISDDVAERIVEISLQNPDFGAKRLVPLLKKAGIRVTSSAAYRILKRRGLQTSEKRLAKATETSAEPIYIPKTFPEKIPPEVEDRIVEISLQNPDYGAGRLTPLLQQEEIFVSSSAVYTILKRNNVENRQKRLLKLEERQALETSPAPAVEGPVPVPEQLKIELPPAVDEVPEVDFEPTVVVPMPPEDEMPIPADMSEPVPEPVVIAPAEPERPPLKKASKKPIKKWGNWVFYPLYLLLFALIGYLGFHAFQVVQIARIETEVGTATESITVGIAARAESLASVRPLAGYRQIWKRNLFNTGKVKEPESEKKISIDKLALAKKDLGLELVGTVVADDPVMSRAIIDNRSIKKQEAYREGDTAGKVKIKKILRNNVVITTAKGDELLTVEIKESGKRSTPSSPTRRFGSSSTSKQQTPRKPRSSARTSSISLKHDDVEASLADIDGLKEQVGLTPYMQGDEPSGFRVGNIPADSVLRKMGLRSRDVIIGVDEESITSPDQASDFFQKLAEGGEVTIKLKRRRRTRQIRLNIE